MAAPESITISKKLAFVNALSSVGARVLNIFVLVWLYQYLITRIPVEEFAVYPVVMAIMTVAPLFFTIFNGGIGRYVIDAVARGDEQGAVRVVSSIWPALIAAGCVMMTVTLGFSLVVEDVFNIPQGLVEEARIMMVLIAANLATRMIASPFMSGYFVRQRFVELNALQIGREVVKLILLLVLLLLVSTSVVWVVVAMVASEMLYVLVATLRSRQMLPWLRFDRHLIDFKQMSQLTTFGMWTSLGQLGSILHSNAATMVLNIFGSPLDVTNYFLGATMYRQLQGMITTASQPLQPAITAMNALKDRARLAKSVLRGGRYGLWVALIAAAPMAIFAEEFIMLYLGPDHADAATVIVLFMIIFPFTQATALLPITAIATARVRAFFLPAFLFQLAGLVLMVVAGKYGTGAVGVTVAVMLITVASQLTYYWWLCLRLIGTGFAAFLREVLVPGLAPAVAGSVVWFGLKFTAPLHTWLELGAAAAVGGAIYAAVLLGLCLTAEERADVLRILGAVRLVTRRLAPGRPA